MSRDIDMENRVLDKQLKRGKRKREKSLDELIDEALAKAPTIKGYDISDISFNEECRCPHCGGIIPRSVEKFTLKRNKSPRRRDSEVKP